jgi:hypothetical protein
VDDLVAVGALLFLVLSLLPACVAIRRERRGLARPLTFFVAASAVYFVMPMALAFTDGTAPSSVAPILLVAVANLCFIAAHEALPLILRRARQVRNFSAAIAPRFHLLVPRLRATTLLASYLGVAVVASGVFYGTVGGLDYLCHLNVTGATTTGMTYFLWGMLLPKTAALAALPSRARFGVPFGFIVAYTVLAVCLVLLTGARIFLLVAMIQAALIYHLAIRRLRTIEVGAFLAVLLAVAVLYGEYRIESGTAACAGVSLPPMTIVLPGLEPPGDPSETRTAAPPAAVPAPPAAVPASPPVPTFLERLQVKATNPQYLRDRYTKNFADALDVFRRIYAIVPSRADYLGGSSFARLLLQPIPRALRPAVPPPPEAITAEFTSPGGANVFQLWAEAYLNFGPPGVVIVALIAGLAGAGATKAVDAIPDNSKRSVYIGLLITSMLLLYRGSFIGATSLALMDLIPVLVFFGLARVDLTHRPKDSARLRVEHQAIHV